MTKKFEVVIREKGINLILLDTTSGTVRDAIKFAKDDHPHGKIIQVREIV